VFRVPETTPEDAGRYEEMLKQVAPMVMQMTRSLEQAIRTITMSKKATHMPRGKLDMKRLVPLVTGLDKRVFFRKEEGLDLDVAVSITIDESGSMRHGKSEAVRDMAIVLGEVLDQLGIPFEIVGGTTANVSVGPPEGGFDRTNPIVVDLFKTFGENWKTTRPRMLRVSHYNNYIDGEVIEMEAKRLLGRHERRKIVFSLSDGSPNAGHDNNRRMGQNLIEVCEKARKAGVEVFGFGIGTDEPKQFYGEKWFVYLESLSELGQKFISEFAGIISKGQLTFA
jgi:cobaltochelatase CobT